jgi:RNA polymerase sigma-70 factor (ECF subfamily)
MTNLRLVSSRPRTAIPQPGADHPCLGAFQLEFDYIVRSLRRLGVPRDDVEDLVHEVFLALNGTWDKYDASRPLRPYLFGIAFRVAASHRRKTWRELPCALFDIDDSAPRPDQALQTKQARALVLIALERIPLPRRAVFVMHDIDEVGMRDIASTLSIPLFTAYSRLRKARKEFVAAVASLSRASEP